MKYLLNGVIVVLIAAVAYFSLAFVRGNASNNSTETPGAAAVVPSRVVQLDVLNGCGARGVAAKFTSYLRASGFDVVEMKNYKTKNVSNTLVVDRVGNLAAAQTVAAVLGVSKQRVIQQINPDYFVDVSVIVGEDYAQLQPLR
jgi:hypothetical protein